MEMVISETRVSPGRLKRLETDEAALTINING